MKQPVPRAGVVGVVLSLAGLAGAGVIDPALAEALTQAKPGEAVSTLLYLTDRVDTTALSRDLDDLGARLTERREIVVRALRERAAATQGSLTNHLRQLAADGRIEGFQTWWVSNVVRVEAVPAEIAAIAARADVQRVYLDHPITLIVPVESTPAGPRPAGAIEPGLLAIRAPEVWAMGFDGAGMLVATLDTGVDGSHPALASRWRGLHPPYGNHPEWAFFDPFTSLTFPQDNDSHGTHTMGSICGGPPGDQVGVAPGAQWICASVIGRGTVDQTISAVISAFEWIVDPAGNPGADFDVPTVCANSWGLDESQGVPDCDETFWSFIDAAEAAGIVVIFSAGNTGPGAGTVRRPADRATDEFRNLAVAAVDANDPGFVIASFSSRGPVDCTPDGESATKPEIAAPGVDVRSSIPGGEYGLSSGTSMAAPHIAGVVALMRQANPDLSVEQVKQILYDTASDLGPFGEDDAYGWGIVDAYEAVQAALSQATLVFSFPEGRPELIDPAGGTTVAVVISGQASPVPGSGALHYSTGGSFTETPMTETAPNEYEAVFPSFSCGAAVSYFFSADADTGDTIFSPFTAPLATYSAEAFSGVDTGFQDDFELDLGWTVQDSGGLTAGTWERGVPVGGGDRGDPAADADGSGRCYVTGNVDGDSDVDGGTTTLTSPVLDASDPDAVLAYFRWYSNAYGSNPNNDVFVVDVSDDGGASWVILETVGPDGSQVGGGWIRRTFVIADVPGITSSSELRVRFQASDVNAASVVEAGIDAVEVFSLWCEAACPGDADGDGVVGITDFLAVLGNWGPNPGHSADFDDDGVVGITDFLAVLGNWGSCPTS